MVALSGFFGLLKKLTIVILIFAVAIPLRYGSTDPKYIIFRLLHSALSLKHSLIADPARPTLSTEYRAFEEILRLKPLIKIAPSSDPLIFVQKVRESMSDGSLYPKSSQCSITKEVFEQNGHSVDTYWINNHQDNVQKHTDRLMIYLHGGGYLAGGIDCKFLVLTLEL